MRGGWWIDTWCYDFSVCMMGAGQTPGSDYVVGVGQTPGSVTGACVVGVG